MIVCQVDKGELVMTILGCKLDYIWNKIKIKIWGGHIHERYSASFKVGEFISSLGI